ncbi:hypothetical protein PAXRUDRAFT_17123 [Paxillus rubicundulus Ve08.2h10]|uniref:Uncharacterized protein n=1 Tax=Paxillus rubicundulus Ve08.2h10 TaxID=930991 RepID=A0A0D0D3A8_9AGAM|nr:hypothetical protein PAXRUDRAFT_17123 [Paxillus rubicundulus Ve08.2h10]
MSTAKEATLSFVYVIFKGLQDDLKKNLAELPNDTPQHVRNALTHTHRKLSDYYYKYDQSPLYVWAAILDPRMNYSGLRTDAGDDQASKEHIDSCLQRLKFHYNTFCVPHPHVAPNSSTTTSTPIPLVPLM